MLSKTRHIYKRRFLADIPSFTLSNERNPDKAQLHKTVLGLRSQGMSYRQISQEVGLHWTRIGQILRQPNKKE